MVCPSLLGFIGKSFKNWIFNAVDHVASLLHFRANAILNVATFVLFRILLLGWMTRWLTLHRDDVPILFFSVGSLGLATIVGMNIVLFYRILVGDYLGSSKKDQDTDQVMSCTGSSGKHHASTTVHRRQPHLKDMNRIVRSLFEEE